MEKVFIVLFMIALICVGFSLLGVILNLLAVSTNGGRMPVVLAVTEGDKTDSGKWHSLVNNKKDIRFFYFADIFRLTLKKHSLYFSLGDIFIIFGNLGAVLFYGIAFTVYRGWA